MTISLQVHKGGSCGSTEGDYSCHPGGREARSLLEATTAPSLKQRSSVSPGRGTEAAKPLSCDGLSMEGLWGRK